MRCSILLGWLAVAASASAEWIPASTNGTDQLAAQALQNLKTHLDSQSNSTSNCTLETAYRRKEWDTFQPEQKREYIKAVRCLQTLPGLYGDEFPGARTRYDDFVVVHMNLTLEIHGTGNFLTWHRYFVYAYEKALREECGYTGYQPYANWGRYENGVIGSPLFDGSDTSISGNGAYAAHVPIYLPSENDTVSIISPKQGGGCVTDGPFANYTFTLGPLGLVGINDSTPNPLANGYGYNPRCLRRDLNIDCAVGVSDANSTELITQYHDIASFQDWMQGPFLEGSSEYGVHTAGHYIISGDPGGDFYTSPGDPWFWFHHGQIDRTYWIWQNLHLGGADREIAGTITMNNDPPSRNATVEDIVQLGILDGFEGYKLEDLLSTMEGPFCYIYE